MKAALILALTLSFAASCTHTQARYLKYTGIVLTTGGVLVGVDGPLRGDGFRAHETEAGVSLVLVGIALGVMGIVLDPNNASTEP